MQRRLGQNYYKVVNMKLEGISSSRIAKNLNLSRERVRQLWVSYQIKDNEDGFRICSKCNKQFLPKYKFQSTCGCYPSIFDSCIVCNKPTQFPKRQTKFPICTNIECAEHVYILKSQLRKLSKEKRDLIKIEITCPVCSVEYIATLWKAQSLNFKMRCKSCRDGQKRSVCVVCKIPTSGLGGRCKQHPRNMIS